MKFGSFKRLNSGLLITIAAYVGVAVYGVVLYQAHQEKGLLSSPSEVSVKGETQSLTPKATSSIEKQHVFGVAPSKVKELKNAKWKIKGIIVDSDNQGVAIIKMGQEEKVLKEGDKIDSTTSIKTIETGKIIVLKNGELQMLPLFTEDKGSPIKVKALPVAPKQKARLNKLNRQDHESIENMRENFKNLRRGGYSRGFGGYEEGVNNGELDEEQAERIEQLRQNFGGMNRRSNR